jgi:hypothetical protein
MMQPQRPLLLHYCLSSVDGSEGFNWAWVKYKCGLLTAAGRGPILAGDSSASQANITL